MKSWIIFKSNHKNPESDKAYKKLSKKNKDTLKKWLYEKSILSKSDKRAGNRRRAIIKLLRFVKKDYDKITYDDYVNVASAISKCDVGVDQKNGDRYFISRFLRDTFDNCEKKFKGLQLLKSEVKSEENKLTNDDLITEEEFSKMLKSTSDLTRKALLVILYETAGRPEEVLKLRWSDVDLSRGIIYLYSGKTKKKRGVPVENSLAHLERLKEEVNAQDDDLIFPSIKNKPISVPGLSFILQGIAKKAKINRRIFPYLFRHTRLNILLTQLSSKVYEEVAGHSLTTGMKTYAHLSQDKIIQEMKERVWKVKKLTQGERDKLTEEINQIKKQQKQFKEVMLKVLKSADKENLRKMLNVSENLKIIAK